MGPTNIGFLAILFAALFFEATGQHNVTLIESVSYDDSSELDDDGRALQQKLYYVYKSVADKVDWCTALRKCIDKGQRLATVESVAENDALVSLLAGSRDILWLSGNDCGKEGSYIWYANWRPIGYNGYSNWAVGEPSNVQNSEHCLGMSVGKWNDYACATRMGYVCQKFV